MALGFGASTAQARRAQMGSRFRTSGSGAGVRSLPNAPGQAMPPEPAPGLTPPNLNAGRPVPQWKNGADLDSGPNWGIKKWNPFGSPLQSTGTPGTAVPGSSVGWQPTSPFTGSGSDYVSGLFASLNIGGVPKPDFSLSPQLPMPDDHGINALLPEEYKKIIGGQTRYSPEVIDSLKGDLKRATSGQLTSTLRAVDEDAAGRGLERSGLRSDAGLQARMRSASDYTTGVQDVMQRKAETDFEDKLAAMDRAQGWLDQLRSFYLANESNLINRDQIRANLELMYMKMAQDRQSLMAQMANQYDIARISSTPQEGRDYIRVESPPGSGQYKMVPIPAIGVFNGGV